MDKRILNITDDCSDKLEEIIKDNDKVSYCIIAVEQRDDDDGIIVNTKCAMGGSTGGVAAGILATLERSPYGKQVWKAFNMLRGTTCRIDYEE